MTKLTTGLKQLAGTSMSRIRNLSGRYNGMAGKAHHSYRLARVGCKKLKRKMRQNICQITERNRIMAQEHYENGMREARQQAENDSNNALMFMAFMMMFAPERPQPVQTQAPQPLYQDAPDYNI